MALIGPHIVQIESANHANWKGSNNPGKITQSLFASASLTTYHQLRQNGR